MKLPHVAYKILWALNMCPRIDGEWVSFNNSRHITQYIRGGLNGCGFYDFYSPRGNKPRNVFKIKSWSDAALDPSKWGEPVKIKKRNWMGIFK